MDRDGKYNEIFGDGDITMSRMPGSIGELLVALVDSNGGLVRDMLVTGDELSYHEGEQILLPNGMSPDRACKILRRIEADQETETRFDRQFHYRADDGAYATAQVIKARYGMSIGERLDMGFFGSLPPESRTIQVDLNTTVQVPWGNVSIPVLKGVEIVLCDGHPHRDYGQVFDLHVTAPKKYKKEIETFFAEVETYLKENSIYRGKALRGADRLEFLDLSEFDPKKVVFSNEVTSLLNGTVWSVIRHTDALREEGIPRKKAVLLYGPYGTGKTSIGQLTALLAAENGWTFLSAGPDDDVDDVMMTARLYMPAVVFIEDIDTQSYGADYEEVTSLLDTFDGITAKGGELVIVLTTNHFERIHKGMLRPGRLDGVVEVGSLDRSGVESLIKAVVNQSKLERNVDYDAVYEAMEGFFPAFVRGAVDRAVTFAVDRLNGSRNYVLSTEDLVSAAKSLRPQLEALHEAGEAELRPSLDSVLIDAVKRGSQQAVHGAKVQGGTLRVPALNGNGLRN